MQRYHPSDLNDVAIELVSAPRYNPADSIGLGDGTEVSRVVFTWWFKKRAPRE